MTECRKDTHRIPTWTIQHHSLHSIATREHQK